MSDKAVSRSFVALSSLLPGLSLVLCGVPLRAQAQANLESPSPEAFVESGIGLIRGWVCNATQVEVSIDGEALRPTAYGTKRGDTEAVCGDTNNGFGLTFPWYQIGDGVHNLRAFADGVVFADVNFTVVALSEDFLTGLSGEYPLANFPSAGVSSRIRWSEPHQNFVFVRSISIPDNPNPPSHPRAHLESPTQGSYESGIGLIRGWVCEASQVEVSIDGEALRPTAYGTKRGDTEDVCGDSDNGFGLTFPWYQIGDGAHNLRAFADGVEFANVNFAVTTISEGFLTGLDAQFKLANFPEVNQTTNVRWSEPHQNFVVSKTTATPAKIATIAAITDRSNPIAVTGASSTSKEATGLLTIKDTVGQILQIGGVNWADTDARVSTDLILGDDGLPARYQDSSGTRARFSAFTEMTVTVEFVDSNDNPQAEPVTVSIQSSVLQALQEIINLFKTESAASLAQKTRLTPSASLSGSTPATTETSPLFSLNSLFVNAYWYGSLATAETLCAVQKAATAAGVANVVASTACDSPLIKAFLLLASLRQTTNNDLTDQTDPVAQQSLQFDADIAEAPCNPADSSLGCLTPATEILRTREAQAGDAIPPAPPVTVPSAPTGLNASDGLFSDRISVTWNIVSEATNYQVYRSTSSSGGGAQIGQMQNTSLNDFNIVQETTYWYSAKACNDAGCSDFSNIDSGFATSTAQ
ncbi:MAG: fibronectin type III domain-containing protein [Candidatus Competibacteraceae bacterium]|nr:fibronectin type III domain-containing protein [Candidatus Competibacteraceae bacterium]MCP5127758.1 fibronectin type III domain-containing protein [Gammaproteobacteria bacterium]HRX70139.1 fibronectin type III domain-containing protein [Candidatus Competibacteraceae bacterium]